MYYPIFRDNFCGIQSFISEVNSTDTLEPMSIEPPGLCRSTVAYNVVLTINKLPPRKHPHLEKKINPGSWSPSSKLAMTMSQKIYIQVFRNRHEVVNVVNIGIKDFYRNKEKLPPVGLDLMITGSRN